MMSKEDKPPETTAGPRAKVGVEAPIATAEPLVGSAQQTVDPLVSNTTLGDTIVNVDSLKESTSQNQRPQEKELEESEFTLRWKSVLGVDSDVDLKDDIAKSRFVLEAIRKARSGGAVNTVLIPHNTREFPIILECLEKGASVAGMTLQRDPENHIVSPCPELWSLDNDVREKASLTLMSHKPEVISGTCHLSHLLDSLVSLPSREALECKDTAVSSLYIVQLIGQIYQENDFNEPLNNYKAALKMDPAILKQKIIGLLLPCVGTLSAARCLENAISLILRRILRRVNREAVRDSNERWFGIYQFSVECALGKRSVILQRLYRKRTVEKSVPVDPTKPKGKRERRKQILLQKPKFNDGPSTLSEKSWKDAFNRAFTTFEPVLNTMPDLDIQACEWSYSRVLSRCKVALQVAYNISAVWNRSMTQRKNVLRAECLKLLKANGTVTGIKADSQISIPNDIWVLAENEYITRMGSALEDSMKRDLSAMVGLDFTAYINQTGPSFLVKTMAPKIRGEIKNVEDNGQQLLSMEVEDFPTL